jgi:hypothetical protein
MLLRRQSLIEFGDGDAGTSLGKLEWWEGHIGVQSHVESNDRNTGKHNGEDKSKETLVNNYACRMAHILTSFCGDFRCRDMA